MGVCFFFAPIPPQQAKKETLSDLFLAYFLLGL